ncbi:MAG: hypothetical protein D6775_12270 [Caldilineae bacterium]|nr:MAG: hypothetical protein D6775_12270 [Caldilineae bacterium]
MQEGDVLVSVDGVPFAAWLQPEIGNYQALVRRDGQEVTIELPVVALIRINALPLTSGIVAALVFWATGSYLLWRRPRQQSVRILFVLAQVFAVAVLLLLAFPQGVRPMWISHVVIAAFHLAAPLLLHHVLTFPVPLGSRKQRARLLLGVYVLAAVMLGLSWQGGDLTTRLAVLYTTLEVAAALAVLVYVYFRRATPDGRRRVRLILFGNLLAGLPALALYLLPSIAGSPYRMPSWLMGPFLIIAPASYLVAVARHNLFGIDRLLNRSLVYLLLSLAVFLLYLGPFLLIYRYLPNDSVLELLLVVGLTMLVGFGFDWARAQVQRAVDHLFYGGWYDYAGVVETISDELARTLDREQLAYVLTQRVAQLMQLYPGRLEFDDAPRASPASDFPVRFTLSFQNQPRARWWVGARRDGDDFSETDRHILRTVAHQADLALDNVLLVEQLRRQLAEIRTMQQRLLRSREEERARLARDLHDGPLQALIALNLRLGLLLSVTQTPEQRAEQVQAMREEVRRLLADMRQTSAALRPPMLDALGLGAALQALADEWVTQTGVAVHLDLPPAAELRHLPDEVAVNLYRIVQEALTNIARHAAAQNVLLQMREEAGCLTLIIQDDGRGFVLPAAAHDLVSAGHFGLAGMQERATLIGGQLWVESEVGQGTTVRLVWPHESDNSARRPQKAALES